LIPMMYIPSELSAKQRAFILRGHAVISNSQNL